MGDLGGMSRGPCPAARSDDRFDRALVRSPALESGTVSDDEEAGTRGWGVAPREASLGGWPPSLALWGRHTLDGSPRCDAPLVPPAARVSDGALDVDASTRQPPGCSAVLACGVRAVVSRPPAAADCDSSADPARGRGAVIATRVGMTSVPSASDAGLEEMQPMAASKPANKGRGERGLVGLACALASCAFHLSFPTLVVMRRAQSCTLSERVAGARGRLREVGWDEAASKAKREKKKLQFCHFSTLYNKNINDKTV